MKKLFTKAVNALSDRLINLSFKLEGYPCEPQSSCSEASEIIDDIHSIINHLKAAQGTLDYLTTEQLGVGLFSEETGEALFDAFRSTANAFNSMQRIDGIYLKGIR